MCLQLIDIVHVHSLERPRDMNLLKHFLLNQLLLCEFLHVVPDIIEQQVIQDLNLVWLIYRGDVGDIVERTLDRQN